MKNHKRYLSAVLSVLMILQIFAQPVLAVQNNDKEGETKSTLSETHLKESKSIIETDLTDKEDDLKDKLSPLEYFYAQNLEEEKAGLAELKPVVTTITVSYKDFEKLNLPIVIDDSTGNIESTRDNLLSLYSSQESKGKEVLWTQTFILDNLQNLEELKVNFESQNDNLKDLKIISVTATDGEKEEELFKEELKENKELKELDLTKEVKPGYKYEISLSSEIKDLQKDYGLTAELSKKSIDEKPLVEKFENVVKGKEEEKAEEAAEPTQEKSTESTETEIEETKATEETQIKEDEKPTLRNRMLEQSSETKIDSLLKRSRMSLLGASNGLEISEDLISPAVGQSVITANLNIKKVDQNGDILPGAKFNLSGNGINKTETVPENGILKFEGLTPGEYFLLETEAPDGYTISEAMYKIVVTNTGEIYYQTLLQNARSAPSSMAVRTFSERLNTVKSNDFLSPINISNPVGASNSIVKVTSYNLVDSRGADKKLETNNNESLKMTLGLSILQAARGGDTFTIKLDDKLVPSQLMPLNDPSYTFYPPTIDNQAGDVIANGVYDKSSNTITYTLTNFVDNKTDIILNVNLGNLGVNRSIVKNSGNYGFINTIGGVAQAEKRFDVDYGQNQTNASYPELDAKQFITQLNPQTNTLRYVLYLNPDGNGPSLPTTLYLREMIQTTDPVTGEKRFTPVQTETDVQLSKANISFYKIPKNLVSTLMPGSLAPDLNSLSQYKVNKPVYTSTNQGYHKEIPLSEEMYSNGYIVVVDAPYAKDASDVSLGFVWKYNSKPGAIVGNSYITTFGSSASGDGSDIIRETTITVVNKRYEDKGSFSINKKDESGKALINATFELVDDETGVSTEAKSNEEGKVYFDALVPGTYTLREKSAPEGYKKSNMEWKVYVRNDGRTFIVEAGIITPNNPSTGGKDISNDITLTGNLSYTDSDSNGKLDINKENNIKADLNIKKSGPVNPGDYFVLEVSDTLHYNMLQPDKYTYPSILSGNNIIAVPSLSSEFKEELGTNKKIIYTFTEAVKGLENLDINLSLGQSVNVNVAKYNSLYDFYVKVANTSISKKIEVSHDEPAYSKNNNTLNINARYLYTNDQSGMYTQLIYVNPDRQNITGTNTVSIFEDPQTSVNMANVSKENTKITVYRYKDGDPLPEAVILENDRLEEVNAVTRFENFNLTSSLPVYAANIELNNIGRDAYVIKVDGQMKDLKNAPLNQYAVLRDSSNNKAIKGSGIGNIENAAAGTGTGDYTPPKVDVANMPIDKSGKFEINKTDENNKPLAGAEFTLTPTKPSGDTIAKTSEEGTGKVLFDNLKPGEYELTESKAPDGYKKSDKTWAVLVDENGVTTLVEQVAPVGAAGPSSFRSALFSRSLVGMRLMALPTGTQNEDITIKNPGSGNYGTNTVITSAKYLGNDTFEVKLDVTAGPDVGTPGQNADLLILVQGNQLTDAVKNALIEKLNSYGDNARVAFKIYNPTASLDKSLNFSSPQTIANEIRNYTQTNQKSNATAVTNALKSASTLFNNARNGAIKEVVHITGIGVDPSDANIKNAATFLRINGVKINNYYVGNSIGASVPINYWNRVLGISDTVNATTNTQTVIKNNMPSYGGAVAKAIENAIFKVTFNNNFTFVGGSTNTYKTNPQGGKWHSSYSNGEILLDTRNGELSLNAGQTATMTFQVKSASTVTAGQEYKLINDITFKPNANAQSYSISAPTIQVAENNLKLTVETVYDGPVRPDDTKIDFQLKRRVESGSNFVEDPNFYQYSSVGLNKHISNNTLPKKDSNGNLYQYYIAETSSTDNNVKVIYIEPEQGISDDGTITIHVRENKGFNVNVDWQGMTPVGIVSAFLSDNTKIELTSSNDYFYKDTSVGAENKILSSATGAIGYKFDVVGENGSYTIKVSKASTEIPSITVKNEKASQFTVIKTDDSGEKVLEGATFTLTGPNGYNKELTTGEDGKAIFKELTVGEYTLTETKAPEGYEKNSGT